MWWFAATHANLLMLARQYAEDAAAQSRVLDAGCGTGGLLAKLAADRPQATVFGLDADQQACERAVAKSARPVCRGSVNALPFAEASLSAIFSADVLCHRDVDERQALFEFRRCLMPGGILVLNLPAYGWMLSRHDAAVYNVRRYTRSRIARLLRVRPYPAPIEALCRAVTGFERALLKGGLRLPFGGSLIAIAGKSAVCEDAHA